MFKGQANYFRFLTIASILFISACFNGQDGQTVTVSEKNTFTSDVPLEKSFNPKLENWVNYYHSKDSTLSLDGFSLYIIDTLKFIPGNVLGSFQSEFDSVYLNFLLYNSDRSKYLDIDSYSWFITKNGEIAFSPDQEINLVDVI